MADHSTALTGPKRSPPGEPGSVRREQTPAAKGAAGKLQAGTFPFRADLGMSELDERGRPGPAWAGRACELSRSQLAFKSRRLCYEGREILLAVHLVDDRPVPLCGIVKSSDYDGDGLYLTRLNLIPLPDTDAIKAWIAPQNHRP